MKDIYLKTAPTASLIFLLIGCSSGSATDSSPPVPRNDLPFATDDIDALAEGLTPGEALSIVVRTVLVDQPNLAQTSFEGLEVSFTPNPTAAPGSLAGELVLNGETIVLDDNGFANDFETGGISATLRQDLLGVASVLMSLEYNDGDLVVTDDNNLGTISKSYAVLGFETSPTDTAAFLESVPEVGSTEYNGDFVGLGEIVRVGGDFETMSIDGAISVDVFGSGLIEGFVSIASLTPTGSEPVEENNNISELGGEVLVLGFEEGTFLDGNGFEADLSVVDTGGISGTTSSSIDGVFYGSNAEDLSGTAEIDFTALNGATLVGVGGYVAGGDAPTP